MTATDQFTRPAEDVDQFRAELAAMREDDPPADVPRDQWERPLIVLPDGSDVRAYTRASKYGIKDKETLNRWGKRNIVFGMSRTHALVVRAQAVPVLTGSDNVKELQDIARRAELAAGADYGAMTGSALHLLTQRRDAGEDLSWVDPLTLAAMNAYSTLLDPEWFEILATETFVVHDDLQGAGSFDRVVRLRRRIIWPDGEVWPVGMIVVIDVKTGKITSMPYWGVDFTAQQLTYVEGEPYLPGVTHLADPAVRSAQNVVRVTDQPGRHGRIGWDAIGVPDGPNRDRSLILHVPAVDPSASHWERIDLAEAREDADACRRLRDRWRVPRAQRFLALPALTLTLDVPSGQYPAEPDSGMSGNSADSADSASFDAGKVAAAAAKRAETTEVLRERLHRATSTDAVDALYDAWHASAVWTDALTELCQIKYDALTPPEDVIDCDQCNHDTHICTGCGIGVPHGIGVCAACSLRVALDGATSLATIETLWYAHGPGGDGVWADEHNTASQAAYDRVSPPEEPYDAGADPGHPITAAATTAGALDVPPESPASYPMTIEQAGYGVIALHCHECLLPVDHPQSDDPIAWCDCAPGETCLDAAVACRNRAHDPKDCPNKWGPAPPVQRPEPVAYDESADPEMCTTHGPHPGTTLCPGCIREHRQTTAVGQQAAAEESYAEPGPFDRTAELAALRQAIEDAPAERLDDVIGALYDAHGPTGDDLWDDECSTRAQARYDALGEVQS